MKLITKINLSIGFILFVFAVVSVINFRQSNKADLTLEQVLHSSEVIKTNDNLLRAVLNAQTGLRGFLLSGKENFLEPYYEGLNEYHKELNKLKNHLGQNSENLVLIQNIETNFNFWNDSIAQPLIVARKKVNKSVQAQRAYNSLLNDSYSLERGRIRIDAIRESLELIDKAQITNRQAQLTKLKQSQKTTDLIGTILTIAAVATGIITTFLLSRSIHNRIVSMKNLAKNLSRENFDVKLTDTHHDELSSLSEDMNRMSIKLQKSFDRLHKMNQELDQFAYVVSHDLKAPLRALNNLSEWILEDIGETTPDIQKNLTLMRGRVHRMENLINGILAYSRIGRQEIEKSTFNVPDLLAEIIESIAPPENFTFSLPTTEYIITTEKILLQQVLVNLISNAIKYNDNPEGLVEISISGNPQQYKFKVQDNGPGIPAEYHEKIFGVFQTIEARDTRESTGIGLAIVKKIIEEKNGQIWVESTPGNGTAFIFTWPLTQTVPHPQPV